MVIHALHHVPHCYTSQDGEVIRRLISDGFKRGEKVTLSFSGVGDVPSSFVNAALVALLDDFNFDYLRSHLEIVDSNSQINDMIRRRLAGPARSLLTA